MATTLFLIHTLRQLRNSIPVMVDITENKIASLMNYAGSITDLAFPGVSLLKQSQ
jgi:hypothetical protein